jgi:hypothetical protein
MDMRAVGSMPNWCFNALAVEDETIELERLAVAVEGEECALDFERIDPMPPELEGTQPDMASLLASMLGRGRAKDWYTWRLEHWGCKWALDPSDLEVCEETGRLEFRFSSAGSSPRGIVATLAVRFPRLGFRLAYYELGNAFAGVDVHGGPEDGLRERAEGDCRALIEREFGEGHWIEPAERRTAHGGGAPSLALAAAGRGELPQQPKGLR